MHTTFHCGDINPLTFSCVQPNPTAKGIFPYKSSFFFITGGMLLLLEWACSSAQKRRISSYNEVNSVDNILKIFIRVLCRSGTSLPWDTYLYTYSWPNRTALNLFAPGSKEEQTPHRFENRYVCCCGADVY